MRKADWPSHVTSTPAGVGAAAPGARCGVPVLSTLMAQPDTAAAASSAPSAASARLGRRVITSGDRGSFIVSPAWASRA